MLLCCDKICCFKHCQHIYDIKNSRALLALFSHFLVILLFWNANLYHTHRFTHNKILTAITGVNQKVGGPRNFMRGPENFIVPPPFNFYFNPCTQPTKSWSRRKFMLANYYVQHQSNIKPKPSVSWNTATPWIYIIPPLLAIFFSAGLIGHLAAMNI